MTRAESIKSQLDEQRSRGEIVDKIHIIANGTGFDYGSIFGKYLDDKVKEVCLEEPYLREYYQVSENKCNESSVIGSNDEIILVLIFNQLINFIRFCELVVSKCRNLKFISVTTVKDPNGARSADQISAFNAMTTDLKNRNITLSVDYSGQLHDRQIM